MSERLENLDQIVSAIRSWGHARNIPDGSTPERQFLKLVSEVGELGDKGIGKGNLDEVKDGIGDALVVLVMIATQYNLTLTECALHAYNEIKDRRGVMYNGLFIKESDPEYPRIYEKLFGDW